MDNSLQYKAALSVINNTSNKDMSNSVLIEMLCNILGLPLPDENEFKELDSTAPTVGSLKRVYDGIYPTDDHLGIAMWALHANNIRLMLYYSRLICDKDELEDMAHYAFRHFLMRDRTDDVVMVMGHFNYTPTLEDLVDGYGYLKERDYGFYGHLLSMTTIGTYDEEVVVISKLLKKLPGNDSHTFEVLLNRLLEVDSYRQSIQEALDTTPLSPFDDIPVPLNFIRLLEDNEFIVMGPREIRRCQSFFSRPF